MSIFVSRFAAESEALFLPIFQDFANRFGHVIAAVGRNEADMARFLAKIASYNLMATQAALGAKDIIAQKANGDYEVFKAELLQVYRNCLEMHFAKFENNDLE